MTLFILSVSVCVCVCLYNNNELIEMRVLARQSLGSRACSGCQLIHHHWVGGKKD